jgi:YD repeat-containing protein
MTRDELIELISDVTSLLGTALAQHVELTESLSSQGVESQKQKLDSLKARMADEKLKLAKLKDAAKRKRELEKLRHDHERQTANEGKSSAGRIQLLNGQGRLIGWLHNEANGKVTVYDAKGRLVARELTGGITLDRFGRVVGRCKGQGLVVLGRRMAA